MRPEKQSRILRKLAVKKWKESGSSFGGWGREEGFLSSDLDWFDVQIFKTDCKEPFGREEFNIKDKRNNARKKNKNAPGYDVSEMEGGVGAGGAQSTGGEWTCTWMKVGFSLEKDQNEV